MNIQTTRKQSFVISTSKKEGVLGHEDTKAISNARQDFLNGDFLSFSEVKKRYGW